MEYVFAQLKAFKILTNTFALDKKRLSTCYRAVAVVYNMNLAAKNAGIPKVNFYESDPLGTRFVASCFIEHARNGGLIAEPLCLASYYSPQAHRTAPALLACA